MKIGTYNQLLREIITSGLPTPKIVKMLELLYKLKGELNKGRELTFEEILNKID